jgi:hypothetical protein
VKTRTTLDRTGSNGSSRRMSVVVQRLHDGTTRVWSHSGGGWPWLLLLLLLCLTTTTAVGAVAAFVAPSRCAAAAPSHSSSSTIITTTTTTTTTAGSFMFAVPRIFRVEHLSFRRRQRFGDNWKSKGRIRNVVPPQPYVSTVLSLSQWKSSMYDEHHHRPMRQQQQPLSLNTVTVEARDDNNSDWRREWGVFDYYTTQQQQPVVVTTTAQQREGNHDYYNGRTRTTATTTTTLECPETIRAVVQASAAAICAALCHHYEPEQAQPHPKGKMAKQTKSTSSHHHHQLPPSSLLPRGYINSGRIGIEVDFGGGHDDGNQESSRTRTTTGRRTSSHNEAATVRYAALLLAARLAQDIAWQPYESTTSTTTLETPLSPPLPPPRLRPIAVYFNTVQQALAASQQLLQLKRVEWHRHTMDATTTSTTKTRRRTTTTSRRPATVYDSILIRCLCQGDSIPNEMLRYYAHEEMENISNSTIPSDSFIGTNDKGTSRSYRAKKSAARVDPTAGLLLIVQPTDYNTDFEPQPGPVLSAAQALQQLAMRASLEQLGMVLLSPRFVNYPATDCSNCLVVSSHGTGWDERRRRRPLSPLSPLESGKTKFAQSSSFAGLEPPRGATPWILRDFGPPIFTWVAQTLPLESRSTAFTSLRQRRSLETSLRFEDDTKATHLVLWQSILHPDAAWHLFAVSAPKVESRSRSSGSSGVRVRYIASTKSATGRPTRDILRRLYLDHLLCCTT